MFKFLKNIFSKESDTSDEEYLDFSEYTDVSIDLKKVHKKENYSEFLRENQEKKTISPLRDIAPPLPKLEKKVEEKLVIPSERKVDTDIDTRKINDAFEVKNNQVSHEEVAVKKHEERVERTSRGIVSALGTNDQTYSKDLGTVQFELQKDKTNKNRKPVLFAIALLLGVLVFLSLGSKDKNIDSSLEQDEEILSEEILAPEDEIRVDQKVDFLALGPGLAYNCEKKHWACLDKENFMKCRELSSDKKCFGVKVYKSKSICQKVQQKSVDLNRRIKSCR